MALITSTTSLKQATKLCNNTVITALLLVNTFLSCGSERATPSVDDDLAIHRHTKKSTDAEDEEGGDEIIRHDKN